MTIQEAASSFSPSEKKLLTLAISISYFAYVEVLVKKAEFFVTAQKEAGSHKNCYFSFLTSALSNILTFISFCKYD